MDITSSLLDILCGSIISEHIRSVDIGFFDKEKSVSLFRKKAEKHTADKKKNVTLETFDGDILLSERLDRRILPDVPDPTGQRASFDRRGVVDDPNDVDAVMKKRKSGIRYKSKFPVTVDFRDQDGKAHTLKGESRDISETGILVRLEKEDAEQLKEASETELRFDIPPGSMPEGHEMSIHTAASCVRVFERDGETCAGFEFAEDLGTYMHRHKDRYLYVSSVILLLFISMMVVLMRSESVIYFKYNAVMYSYSIIAAMFLLTRYAFGALYRPVKIDPAFKPSVTIIIPCFNEETWISRTIISCMNQNYPPDKLEVIVVDDCSTDRSVEVIKDTIEKIASAEGERMNIRNRLSYIVQEQNAGKRAALCRGVDVARRVCDLCGLRQLFGSLCGGESGAAVQGPEDGWRGRAHRCGQHLYQQPDQDAVCPLLYRIPRYEGVRGTV